MQFKNMIIVLFMIHVLYLLEKLLQKLNEFENPCLRGSSL